MKMGPIAALALLVSCAFAQTAVLVDGQPAVRCEANRDLFTVRRGIIEGRPAFRVNAFDPGWTTPHGVLTISPDAITFDGDAGQRVVATHHDASADRYSIKLKASGHSRRYLFATDEWEKTFGRFDGCWRLVQTLVDDFAGGLAQFEGMTSSLNPVPKPEPPKSMVTVLRVSSHPGGAQVYLDDMFKGQTGENGDLQLEASPGEHVLRVDLADYKEWKGKVTIAGEHTEQKVDLVKRGPEPLSVDEIDQALSQGMTPARCGALVKQYGVNFAMTPDIDKRLRDKGADSDLLVTIAENKR